MRTLGVAHVAGGEVALNAHALDGRRGRAEERDHGVAGFVRGDDALLFRRQLHALDHAGDGALHVFMSVGVVSFSRSRMRATARQSA